MKKLTLSLRKRNKNARTVTVTDRPVAEGDTAVIDFEGFVDGVALRVEKVRIIH